MRWKNTISSEVARSGLGLQQTRAGEGWLLGRWWRVVDKNGKLLCETSDEEEARERMRPGDFLMRELRKETRKWVVVEDD